MATCHAVETETCYEQSNFIPSNIIIFLSATFWNDDPKYKKKKQKKKKNQREESKNRGSK